MKKILKLVVAISLMVASLGSVTESFAAQKKNKAVGTAESPLKVTVSSLKELLPYLKKDYVELTMTPGTYRISVADTGMFNESTEVVDGSVNPVLFLFKGNHSTYDFTGVTIEIMSPVINAYPGKHRGVYELQTIGNHNIIKGLKLLDMGRETDFPNRGWVNVVMDGSYNRLEGVEINSRGSKPYGYGEAFGKGRVYVLKHWKHSACLVRGDFNHVKDCRIIHHAYGHYLFMQGAKSATIEGTYIEGKMTSTDIILAEKGTGSSADKIGFKTVWGYTLPAGYTLCLGEDGIRTYTAGNTIINGEKIARRTGGDIVVKDCTVKHARGGVAITLGEGTRYVENCTLIGCQHGFSVNNGGKIVNCRSDAALGEAFGITYDRNSRVTADVTIMPYTGNTYGGNGSKQAAFIMGANHNITLRKGDGFSDDQGLYIAVGGERKSVGSLDKDENYKASNNTIINETGLPIVLDDNTSGNKIITNGEVTDNGTGNIIERR